jgi:hypothetical protein
MDRGGARAMMLDLVLIGIPIVGIAVCFVGLVLATGQSR